MKQHSFVSKLFSTLCSVLVFHANKTIFLVEASFFHRYQHKSLRPTAFLGQTQDDELQNETMASGNVMPPALRELKERAEFTAKMEAAHSFADSIVQWTTKMAARQKLSSKSRPAKLSSAVRRKATLRTNKNNNILSRFFKPSSPSALPQSLAKKAPSSAVVKKISTGRQLTGKPLITHAPSAARIRSVETIKTGRMLKGKAVTATKIQAAGKQGGKATRQLLKTGKGSPIQSLSKLKAGGKLTSKTITPTRINVVEKQGGKFTKQLLKKARTARRSTVALRKGYIPKTSAVQKLTARKASIQAGRRVALRRVGRFLSLAMPILGGVFAVLAFHSDLERAQDECSNMLALLLFACAALCDYVDILCHCLMTNALFLRGSSAIFLPRVESASMACAILSTISVILGEVRSPKKEEKEYKQPEIA